MGLYKYVIVCFLGFISAWFFQQARWDAAINQMAFEHQEVIDGLESAALDEIKKQREKNDQLIEEREKIDTHHFKELSDARQKNADLTRDIVDANQRLSVRISKPVTPSSDRTSTQCPATSMDDAEVRADLHPGDARDIIALTGKADDCAITITALQEWVREERGVPKEVPKQ